MPQTTTVKTGLVRFSFLSLFEKKAMGEETEGKYRATLLIPKSDKATLKAIEKAIELAKEVGKSKPKVFGGVIPKKLTLPLADGDEKEEYEGFEGNFYLNAKSNHAPQVLGKDRVELYTDEDIKSGDYGRAIVTFYAYNSDGNKGVAVALEAVQLLKRGDALGGSNVDAKSEFDDDFADQFEDEDETDPFA